jgi:hypothetical protein
MTRSLSKTVSLISHTCHSLKLPNSKLNIVSVADEGYPLGWPQLAAFLNSADSFAIFRRFGIAHCRVLVHLQAEITALEKELDALDIHDSVTQGMLYRLRRNEWYEGWDPAQKDLLEKLRLKLSEYGLRSAIRSPFFTSIRPIRIVLT